MADQEPVRVSIVEDDAQIRAMLLDVFVPSSGTRMLSAYGSAEEALEDEPAERPQVVIMDINLPGMDGVECVRRLTKRWERAQFLMYTVNDDDKRVFEALRSGASGYVLKNSSPKELVTAVLDLHAGGAPMSAAIARRVVDHFKPASMGPRLDDAGLGKREHELLTLLADGLYYKEIADRMGISIGTVKSHVHTIYGKLHVQNRTEAVNRFFGR